MWRMFCLHSHQQGLWCWCQVFLLRGNLLFLINLQTHVLKKWCPLCWLVCPCLLVPCSSQPGLCGLVECQTTEWDLTQTKWNQQGICQAMKQLEEKRSRRVNKAWNGITLGAFVKTWSEMVPDVFTILSLGNINWRNKVNQDLRLDKLWTCNLPFIWVTSTLSFYLLDGKDTQEIVTW